jgi:hypothetical protein
VSRKSTTSCVAKFCMLAAALITVGCGAEVSAQSGPSDEIFLITPGDSRLHTPEFDPYEVEYGSAFGRFYNQVRKFTDQGSEKISVLNIIEMPQGVIIDHRTIDAATLRIETFNSPYFAWGKEQVFMQSSADNYSLVRIPIDGGDPIHSTGALENNGYFDSLGFSPTLAAILPLDVGTKFQMPKDQPKKNGAVVSVLANYEVIAKEKLNLPSGLSCDCWVIQETSENGSIHKYWISQTAPFLLRRHRDVGGKRDFISDVITFRSL